MKFRLVSPPWLMLALMVCMHAGQAATFCVDTSGELLAALNTAVVNTEDDEIRIKAGTYANASLGATAFSYTGFQSFAISIQGGWESFLQFDCFRSVDDPTATVLSGSNVRRVLQLSGSQDASGEMVIENLTLRDGNAVERGGGLRLQGIGFTGNVRIERVYFEGNVSDGLGGGASIFTQGLVTLRNNVFLGNRGNGVGAAVIHANFANASNVRSFIGNNTVVANSCNPNPCATGGFFVFGTARASVYNNAFHANAGNDVQFSGTSADLLFNNIRQYLGTPVNVSGNIDVDPMFEEPLAVDFRLKSASSLIDAGTSNLYSGLTDFVGAPRVNGAQIDIGALENTRTVFASSFETLQ